MAQVSNIQIVFFGIIILCCLLCVSSIKNNLNNTNVDFRYEPDKCSSKCSIKNSVEHFSSLNVPDEQTFNEECFQDNTGNKCTRNRVVDKYNLNKINGGQGMYVNIDGQQLVDNKKLQKKWMNKKKGCANKQDYAVYNMPECALDKHKIEFSDTIADSNRVDKSFKIHCNNKNYGDNFYYDRIVKKKKIERKNKKKRIKANKKKQKQVNFNLNGIDFKTAEQFYQYNYGYDIAPLNTTEWYLPANYVEYSEYNRPKLDKIIVNKSDSNSPNSKYRTRAFNWHFGKPLDS